MAGPVVAAPVETPTNPNPHQGHPGGAGGPGVETSGFDLGSWLAGGDAGWWAVGLLLTATYLLGWVIVWRRGVQRSPLRLTSWLVGVATLVAVTTGPIGRLGGVSFAGHMGQHMTLSMLTPILLAAAAPVTLALRALPASGRAGLWRRTIVGALHSRPARVLGHPIVVSVAFTGSLYVLYFTPALDQLMQTHLGHQLMLVHFLLVGLAFFGVVIGADPVPLASQPGIRLATMSLSIPFHAFFGTILMMSTAPTSRFFAATAPTIGLDPAVDQRWGAGIAWGSGEIPFAIATMIVAVQWFRSDQRRARRLDRQADRDDDRALAEYNAYLATLAERDDH